MANELEEKNKAHNKNSKVFDKDLIITLDQNGKIIKFNDECERISGYNKKDILSQDFFEILIPVRYISKWKNIINTVRKDKLIDDFNLPLLTCHGHEIMISWTSFPVKNVGEKVEDIGLVGNIVSSWDDSKQVEIVPEEDDMDMSGYFDEFETVVKELEDKNSELEKKNKELEKKLIKQKTKKDTKTQTDVVGKSIYRVSDVFGGKKNRDELNALMNELDEREKQLNKLETKLNKEKILINERKNEFIRWREKLEILESEVESRRKWVINKEKAIKKFSESTELDSKIKSENQEKYDEDMFSQIRDCAAVIQRGVFKQINSSFASLLGYDTDEVVDKSIFDFIGPEGLTGIEEFYFNRLKGWDVSVYDTQFLTKDNINVSVEVSTKPIIFNGEKAEIAVFKKLKIKKG